MCLLSEVIDSIDTHTYNPISIHIYIFMIIIIFTSDEHFHLCIFVSLMYTAYCVLCAIILHISKKEEHFLQGKLQKTTTTHIKKGEVSGVLSHNHNTT